MGGNLMNVNVSDTIYKPVGEVFSAIVEPGKLSGYFASKVSDKPVAGEKVTWCFEDAGVIEDVDILEVKENELLAFNWSAVGRATRVDIKLKEAGENKTKISITEASFELNEAEMKNAMGQTHGWVDFICSLKAYLYTGVNLRTGK